MRQWVSINGQLMPADDARVSVFDSGFTQGVGLFETMRAYHGTVFRLERHLDRLAKSARDLGWAVIPDSDAMAENVAQVVNAAEMEAARVRLTVTTGTTKAGVDAEEPPELTVVATAAAGGVYPKELYQRGVTVVVGRYRQHGADPLVGHKTTSYFSRLAALREAHSIGAFECLWRTLEANLAEGSISSLFIVDDGTLITPPLDTPVLPGITRATVLEIALADDVPVKEVPITEEMLIEADEVFLTNSMMQLMPVVRVGREPIGAEKPGEMTMELLDDYQRVVERETAHAR